MQVSKQQFQAKLIVLPLEFSLIFYIQLSEYWAFASCVGDVDINSKKIDKDHDCVCNNYCIVIAYFSILHAHS